MVGQCVKRRMVGWLGHVIKVGKFKFRWLEDAENDLRELRERRLRKKADDEIGVYRKGEQGPWRPK
jgi:hypothetical protein